MPPARPPPCPAQRWWRRYTGWPGAGTRAAARGWPAPARRASCAASGSPPAGDARRRGGSSVLLLWCSFDPLQACPMFLKLQALQRSACKRLRHQRRHPLSMPALDSCACVPAAAARHSLGGSATLVLQPADSTGSRFSGTSQPGGGHAVPLRARRRDAHTAHTARPAAAALCLVGCLEWLPNQTLQACLAMMARHAASPGLLLSLVMAGALGLGERCTCPLPALPRRLHAVPCSPQAVQGRA